MSNESLQSEQKKIEFIALSQVSVDISRVDNVN